MISDDVRPDYVLFLTDGLPTAGETQRAEDRRELPAAQQVPTRDCSRSASASTSTPACSTGSAAATAGPASTSARRGHRGARRRVLLQDDPPGPRRASASRWAGPTSTGPILATSPTSSRAASSSGSAVTSSRAKTTVRLTGKVGGERRIVRVPGRAGRAPARAAATTSSRSSGPIRRVGDIIDQIDLNGQNKELIDELVALSTKYGLLTPYTSFLADERVNLHAMRQNQGQTSFNLQALQDVRGESAVEQRRMKQAYNKDQLYEEDLAVTYRGSIDAEASSRTGG